MNMLVFLLIGEVEKSSIFLSTISIYLCMITYYIVEENVFVVFVYKLLEQQKYRNIKLKTFKIKGKKRIKVSTKMNMLDSEIMKE